MKIIRTIVLLFVLIAAGLLWATKLRILPSQSAFAFEPNNIYYWLMHGSIIVTYVLDLIVSKGKRWVSAIVAACSAAVLGFDMYNFPKLHDFFTALTFISASFNSIFYAPRKNRPLHIGNSFTGALLFLLGLWSSIHLFLAEVFVEAAIGASMLVRIWREDK
jgi:hypothetical protein